MYVYNAKEKRFEIDWDCLFIREGYDYIPIKQYLEQEVIIRRYTSIAEALENGEEFCFDRPLKTNKYDEDCARFQDYNGMYTLYPDKVNQIVNIIHRKGFDFSPSKSVVCYMVLDDLEEIEK